MTDNVEKSFNDQIILLRNELWREGKIYIPKGFREQYDYDWDFENGRLIFEGEKNQNNT